MSANERDTTHSSAVDVPPRRDRRRHHHGRRHHHRRKLLRRKLKIGVLIGVGLAVALLAWYLVVTYLDQRALGATLRGLAEISGVHS